MVLSARAKPAPKIPSRVKVSITLVKYTTPNLSKIEKAKNYGFVPPPSTKKGTIIGIIKIGRGKNNDLVLDHPTVSRAHGYILLTSTTNEIQIFYQDSSENGTTVNKKLITKKIVPLTPESVLKIGFLDDNKTPAFSLLFKYELQD